MHTPCFVCGSAEQLLRQQSVARVSCGKWFKTSQKTLSSFLLAINMKNKMHALHRHTCTEDIGECVIIQNLLAFRSPDLLLLRAQVTTFLKTLEGNVVNIAQEFKNAHENRCFMDSSKCESASTHSPYTTLTGATCTTEKVKVCLISPSPYT